MEKIEHFAAENVDPSLLLSFPQSKILSVSLNLPRVSFTHLLHKNNTCLSSILT